MEPTNAVWHVSDEEFRGWAKAKIGDIETLVRENMKKIDMLVWRVALITGAVSFMVTVGLNLFLR